MATDRWNWRGGYESHPTDIRRVNKTVRSPIEPALVGRLGHFVYVMELVVLDMEFPCRPFVSPDFAYELEVIAFYAVFSVFRIGFEPVQAVEFIELKNRLNGKNYQCVKMAPTGEEISIKHTATDAYPRFP